MEPWISNTSMGRIEKGLHHDPGPNSLLIQIVDPFPDFYFPKPHYPFKRVERIKFSDIEELELEKSYGKAITQLQARKIARWLIEAYDNHMNVIVHCVAGVCRSGAVVEAAMHVGFQPAHNDRDPNTQVAKMVIQEIYKLKGEL